MNSAVITKIEYRLQGEQNFTAFDIVPLPEKLKEDEKKTRAGMSYETSANFLIAGMSVELRNKIKSIVDRKAYFRITDADDVVYLVGSTDYPARLSAQMALGGAPGSFKGYRCTITQNSPNGCTIE